MGKKGRRGRSRKTQGRSKSAAPDVLDETLTVPPSAPPPVSTMPGQEPPGEAAAAPCPTSTEPLDDDAGSLEPAAPDPAECTPPPVSLDPPGVDAASAAAPEPAEAAGQPAPTPAESSGEPKAQEPAVPAPSDLDLRFFTEAPSEAWLASELEMRHPQSLRKMTAGVAQRRAHLARYVAGVVGVAVTLCLVALVKSAVSQSDDAPSRPATEIAMPAAQRPAPAEPIAPPATTAIESTARDGG